MKPSSPLRNPIRSSLSIQLLALILLATFIPIGIGALLFHNFVIKGIAKSVEVQTLSTTSLIEDALQHAFVQNDWEVIQKLVFDTGTQHNVEAIRLLGSDGVVLASSIPDEIGVLLDQQAFCPDCEPSEPPRDLATSVHPITRNNRELLVVTEAIDNRISCQSCHGADGPTLGLIQAEFPLDRSKTGICSWTVP